MNRDAIRRFADAIAMQHMSLRDQLALMYVEACLDPRGTSPHVLRQTMTEDDVQKGIGANAFAFADNILSMRLTNSAPELTTPGGEHDR